MKFKTQRSNKITLPKGSGRIDCENHLTIRLMSYATKCFLKIILKRINRIRSEISNEQCGFQDDYRKLIPLIYILRTLEITRSSTDLYII